jgi:hypothetical protein
MKERFGFISNSSSSSFILKIPSTKLYVEQYNKIINHKNYLYEFGGMSNMDIWSVYENEDGFLTGYTMMDNFNMREFLIQEVGIKDEDIEWSY